MLVTHANGALGLIQDALAAAAVDMLVLAAGGLVGNLLGGGLGVVGLQAAVMTLASCEGDL